MGQFRGNSPLDKFLSRVIGSPNFWVTVGIDIRVKYDYTNPYYG